MSALTLEAPFSKAIELASEPIRRASIPSPLHESDPEISREAYLEGAINTTYAIIAQMARLTPDPAEREKLWGSFLPVADDLLKNLDSPPMLGARAPNILRLTSRVQTLRSAAGKRMQQALEERECQEDPSLKALFPAET